MEKYTKETIEFAHQAENDLKIINIRLHKEIQDEASRNRDEYMRDYARILYSSSFRRLQAKMQLLGIDSTNFYRNRLTHSLEVAQIARGIAHGLQIKDIYVVETASLAHDLGNPPFGHYGELVLNELATDIGGFEGNAQTLRIITKLEKKHYDYAGLNLTLRTILSVIKYNNKRSQNNKKFLYDEDYELINLKIEEYKLQKTKSIDCQIMDIADEIAYAAHDLEDTLGKNLLNIDDLLYEFKISEDYSPAYDVLKEVTDKAKQFASKSHRLHSSEEYSFLFRKELISKIVNKLICDVNVNTEGTQLEFKNYGLLSKGLKKLLFSTILRKPSVQLYEKRGEIILKGLFNVYADKSFNKNMMLLPAEYRNTKAGIRSVIDYLSGMMDSFATSEFCKYFGKSALDRLFIEEV